MATLSTTSFAEPPTPADFAYGSPLPVTDDTGLYIIELPFFVYQHLQQNNLGDLQVFNGEGQPVPQAIMHHKIPSTPVRQEVPFFRLTLAGKPLNQDLSIQVRRDTNGSLVMLNAPAQNTALQESQQNAYLLDISSISPAPTTLELRWRVSPEAPITTISLVESSDLAHWRALHDKVVLADLTYNGAKVNQRTITLPAGAAPYLRIDCLDCTQPLELTSVDAVTGSVPGKDQWHWQPLKNPTVTNENGQWVLTYKTPAKMRVTGLDVAFPVPNSLARITIESKQDGDVPWYEVALGDFYRLDLSGTRLDSSFLQCRPTTDNWWRIRLPANGSTFANAQQLPALVLGWQPDNLCFLGRGKGPYTLAFGSMRADQSSSTQDALVQSAIKQAGDKVKINHITPGPMTTLGGLQALTPPPQPRNWSRIILWIILVAGVGLLGLMARSVYREMGQGKK